jgi:hypothetical protein
MEETPFGIAEARKVLGALVGRAVHSRTNKPIISRSKSERAVLISEDDWNELQAFRKEREKQELRDLIAAHERGEIEMNVYTNAEEFEARFGVKPDGSDDR